MYGSTENFGKGKLENHAALATANISKYFLNRESGGNRKKSTLHN